jgi:tRNA(fMet)-specific endonuclease VapC
MNRALIDTDILSYFFKGDASVNKHFEAYLEHYDIIEFSIITWYEITSGLLAKNALTQLAVFEKFAAENLILPVSEKSARISSEIYAKLKQAGKLVDDTDLLIAGIALEHNMIFVTNNESHFQRIPGLVIQNWKK